MSGGDPGGARNAPGGDPGGAREAPGGEVALRRALDRDAELRRALGSLRREIRTRFAREAAPRRAGEPLLGFGDWERGLHDLRLRLATLGMRERSDEIDDFGMDAQTVASWRPWLDLLFERYWRVGVEGAASVPADGPSLFVANRAGLLPWDGLMVVHALERLGPRRERPRFAVADWLMTQPFARPRLARLGAVRACPENVERLLSTDRSVVVFPEGARGATKSFSERYRVQRFGRGGAVRMALETGAPLVPVGIVGAEETSPILYKATTPARALGLPFLPVTPLGAIPLPARWQIHFGEPMQWGDLPPDAARDELLLSRLTDDLRARVQELVDTGLRQREGVWS